MNFRRRFAEHYLGATDRLSDFFSWVVGWAFAVLMSVPIVLLALLAAAAMSIVDGMSEDAPR